MAVLRLYLVIAFLSAPLLRLQLRRRAMAGREEADRLAERFGYASLQRPSGPLVWVHAASVGETISVLPLIGDLLAAHEDLHVLLTTGTVTAAQTVAAYKKRESAIGARVLHQYVPLDRRRWVNRFLDHWRPQATFWVESEIWPNAIIACAARGLKPVMIIGRMSPRSFKNWHRFNGAAQFLLGKFALLTAQDDISAARLRDLGLENIATPGNLKLDAPPLAVDTARLATLKEAIGARPHWLAASTHPGEEEQLAAAHRLIAEATPQLLTIIVPRHPERGNAIADKLRRDGFKLAQRARHEMPTNDTEIYLMDTLGEMGLAYRLTDIAFIGGTLVPHGGQNPFEAAQLDCAILHGPHIANFETLFDDMASKGATAEVTDTATLAAQVKALLNNPASIEQMRHAAKDFSAEMGGARARMAALLTPFLGGRHE